MSPEAGWGVNVYAIGAASVRGVARQRMIEVAIIQIHTANTGTPPSALPTLCQVPAAPCAEDAMMPAAVSSTPPIRPSHVSHRGKRRDSNIARDAVTTETPIGPKISLSVIDPALSSATTEFALACACSSQAPAATSP